MVAKDMEIPEIVGSKDLRETFKDGGKVRGSFFINNVEMHNFEANSIPALLALINAKSVMHYVDASIDDQYHLVLEARSPGQISIRNGAPYQEAPSATSGQNSADEVMRKLSEAADRQKKGDDKKQESVLDMLGLEETEAAASTAGQGGYPFPAGMKKEDREYLRYQRAVASGAIRGMPQELANRHYDGPRLVPQGGAGYDENQKRFNPIPGDPPPAAFVPNPDETRNNPLFQKSPVVNSDHQPTYTDQQGTGAPGPSRQAS
jgi:hypothetical protein